MTIWLLALILVASLAALGYRQGAIRVGISLVGIILGAALALPVGKLLAPIVKILGVNQPLILWLLPPFIAFWLISALFKAGAAFAHHKVEVHYKYHAGDLRLSLWERLNRRLGLCLGVVNGVAYLCLVSFVIYIFSYWTIKMETATPAPWSVRLLNSAGRDLQRTGFHRTARALDKLPADYYHAADVAGLLYRNSLLEARLARYPAFLMLSESPEFQSLATDQQFSEMRVRQAPLNEVAQHPGVKAILDNPASLQKIWGTVQPNLADLKSYLTNGVSEKFSDQPLLGRWTYNARGTSAALRKARPQMSAPDMAKFRQQIEAVFARTRLIIGVEEGQNRLVVRDFPNLKATPAPGTPLEMQRLEGTWDGSGPRFELRFGEQKFPALLEGDRLTVTIDRNAIVLVRED